MRSQVLACTLLVLSQVSGFSLLPQQTASIRPAASTKLHAVAELVKKAKKDELRKFAEAGISDDIMSKYKEMKAAMESVDLTNQSPGPLQQSLTKRKGTITVIAEYKRKSAFTSSGFIKDIYDAELMSPVFREYGAAGIAVMADERMGGCTYRDLELILEEQRRARNEVPGTVPVINNDLIIDELQVARSAVLGCTAVVINLPIVGLETTELLLKAAKAVDLEAIVAVSTHEEAQSAVDAGARMLSVIHVEGIDEKVAVIEGLSIPAGQQVCTIANVLARNDKQLQEIEEAWAVRDKGFNCVWVGEALYKEGSDATEHPGAIIKSMRSKSSLRFASPKASSGKGEGAREYLGDIMM